MNRLRAAFERTRVDRAGIVTYGALRSQIEQVVGAYSAPARWYRRLRPRWLWVRNNRVGKATRRYVCQHGLTVRRGAFADMVYGSDAIGKVSCLGPKLLGCYELELSPFIAACSDFDVFVDIGSGDGYYCVGLKRTFPHMRVIGYETDGAARRVARKLAGLNGVSFESSGRADHGALNGLPSGRILVMVDVEGLEYELVDPDLVPRLQQATMIVEVHPAVHSEIVEILTARFEPSHEIRHVRGVARDIAEYSEVAGWEEAEARVLISEGRPSNPQWLVMQPRVATGDGCGNGDDAAGG